MSGRKPEPKLFLQNIVVLRINSNHIAVLHCLTGTEFNIAKVYMLYKLRRDN